jgi:hypothetical protein
MQFTQQQQSEPAQPTQPAPGPTLTTTPTQSQPSQTLNGTIVNNNSNIKLLGMGVAALVVLFALLFIFLT